MLHGDVERDLGFHARAKKILVGAHYHFLAAFGLVVFLRRKRRGGFPVYLCALNKARKLSFIPRKFAPLLCRNEREAVSLCMQIPSPICLVQKRNLL